MKILVVCLGNICRSPVAEGVLLHLIKLQNRTDITVDSAGTANYHINEAPDKRTIANALKHGVDLRELRARQFTVNDFDQFDLILGMDANNVTAILSLAKNETHRKKVKLFLDADYPNENRSVPDPYYGTEDGFEHVFQLVYKGCEVLLNSV
jgi:protein-tyrosine phosphatase